MTLISTALTHHSDDIGTIAHVHWATVMAILCVMQPNFHFHPVINQDAYLHNSSSVYSKYCFSHRACTSNNRFTVCVEVFNHPVRI